MLCVTILFLLLCVCYFYSCRKPKNYPPGPVWLPLVGCIPTFQWIRLKCGYNYLAFHELARKYGPVLGLKLGGQKVVVISTYDLVKKALLQDEFNGRPDDFLFKARSLGKIRGIIFTEGAMWSQHRKFTMKHLRTFGIGQSIMKIQLRTEARNLVEHLQRMSEHGAVKIHTAFEVAVLNTLWFMFAGHTFGYDDQKLQEMLVIVDDAFRLFNSMGGLISQMPFLRFLLPELSGYNEIMRILRQLWSFFNEEIETHERKLYDRPRDLIDAFLFEISNSKNKHEDTIFDRENLLVLCLDLFMAGSKTTSDTLTNAFLYLSLNTEWLKILQTELDDVVGRSRSPTLDDMPFLPMTEAFLAEILRYLNVAPLGVPHRAVKDVLLNGYQIPEGTLILFNLHSVHNDETLWDRPDEFRPQRFLNDQGQFCQNNPSVPFGLGKRRCLGEILARPTMFLFFTYIIHYFDLEISPDHDKPDINGYDGFTISPKPFYLKLSMRSELKD